VLDRLKASQFEGVVPANRVMTWLPALQRSLEHIYIGHGPIYDTGVGLEFQFWPHNAYIYYLYTLGLFGLGVFVWIMVRTTRASMLHKAPGIDGTDLGTIMKLLQVWFFMSMVVQMRTDHQRDDVYIFIIWLNFGMIAATANIIRKKLSAAEQGASP